MDGDRAPLAALADLAERHGGFLVVDEAHATGVFGPGGHGLAAELEGRGNVVALHTCGKALGLSGAVLSLPAVLAEYLINRARGFIYSTAPSPLMAAADCLEPGMYRLIFETEKYFLGKHGRAGFYPRVVVEFEVKESECGEHFHVPLLLSPFSYTTYRGS